MSSSTFKAKGLEVRRYTAPDKEQWDRFVAQAKNSTFLFFRDYVEYHADRFADHSLMFFERGRVLALLPANRDGQVVTSHGGLTFGGIICDDRMKTSVMLDVFEALTTSLRDQGITRLIYKAVPHTYHSVPAEEDLYALFRYRARVVRRDVSSTILLARRISLTKGRKYALNQSRANGLQVRQSTDFTTFLGIEREVLQKKYGVLPVHTASELESLATRFPDNIRLFAAYKNEDMIAGVVMYAGAQTAHAQYIAATEEGKRLSALDLILDHLMNKEYSDRKYFDFGISTENEGSSLNLSLIANKEAFGARAVIHDFYQIDVG